MPALAIVLYNSQAAENFPTSCRLQIGDTAGCKPALRARRQRRAQPRYKLFGLFSWFKNLHAEKSVCVSRQKRAADGCPNVRRAEVRLVLRRVNRNSAVSCRPRARRVPSSRKAGLEFSNSL